MTFDIKKLDIIYIVPSRYDDDGYVQRWMWGVVPSNSLAVLKSLTQTVRVPNVEIGIESFDDNVHKIPFEKIAARNRESGRKVVVGLVGVQSNQFPRAADIALRFRKLGVDVLIGGFHVSGVISLFDELTPELQTLVDHGVTLICGESETPGVLDDLFADVVNNTLQPIYRFPQAPDLSTAPLPQADPKYVDHFGARWATIDSSRGCPYGCTFCTVINIQGRKMRCRSAEAVLETVNANYDRGVKNFFFTDDNFARNKNWEAIFDRMIEMRESGKKVGFMMQIDTQASKIPHFVDKAKKAGCRMVFIGMESVNPGNIAAAGKTQNHIDQYRPMVQTWQQAGVIVHVGYIIGFPNDSLESIRRDVTFLRDHVGVDLASFFMMTPLPGSVDHREMVKRGEPLDPDLNKYDSFHETFKHQTMAPGEWQAATQLAYSEFYTKNHCTNILRRLPKEHYWMMFWNLIWYRYSGVLSGTHPMMTGFFRQKNRHDRRPGMPRESLLPFGWRWLKDFALDSASYIRLFFEFQEIWFMTRRYVPGKEPEVEVLTTPEIQTFPARVLSRKAARLRYWAPLAKLKLNWNAVKQRAAEMSWLGQYDSALKEINATLVATSNQLRSMSNRLASMMGRREKKQAEKMEAMAGEIDKYLSELESKPKDASLLYNTENFVTEYLLARFEELASHSVRLRRKATDWHVASFNHLKKGRLFRCSVGLVKKPWMAFVESYLSLRFCLAAMRKEL